MLSILSAISFFCFFLPPPQTRDSINPRNLTPALTLVKSSFWTPPGQPQKPESPPRLDSRFHEHERAGISHCQTPLRPAEHRGRLSVCLPACKGFPSPPLRWTLHPPTRSLFFSLLARPCDGCPRVLYRLPAWQDRRVVYRSTQTFPRFLSFFYFFHYRPQQTGLTGSFTER